VPPALSRGVDVRFGGFRTSTVDGAGVASIRDAAFLGMRNGFAGSALLIVRT
jgi:hypothetical protein